MDFFITFQSVSVLFLLIIMGYIVGKVNIISESGQKELTSLLLNVTLPVTIILALQMEFSKERFNISLKIILAFVLSYLLMIILSKVIGKLFNVPNNQRDIIEAATILPNTAFMGYPIILAVLGPDSLFYAVIGAGLTFEMVSWTYGVYVISKNTEFDFRKDIVKNIFLSPGILAVAIGFILFVMSIKIPEPIYTSMNLVSGITSPLAMLIVGILLSRSNVKESLVNKRLYMVALIRLIVFPVLIYLLLTVLGFKGMELIIPVIMLSMPTAANLAMFSEKVNNDTNLASQIVFISSLLSLITIPVIVWLVIK